MTMIHLSRRTATAAFLAMALSACGQGDPQTTATPTTGGASVSSELGHSKGSADAPITLIEYASPTCPACKYFHNEVLPTIEEDYINTGKVRLVFREFPIHQPDPAAYVLALCAGDERYFDVLDDLFANQNGIIDSARNGVLKATLQTIGQRHGIEDEAAFDACMNNKALRDRLADTYQTSEEFSVNSTPTFILNGEKVDIDFRTPEAFAERFEALLAAEPQN